MGTLEDLREIFARLSSALDGQDYISRALAKTSIAALGRVHLNTDTRLFTGDKSERCEAGYVQMLNIVIYQAIATVPDGVFGTISKKAWNVAWTSDSLVPANGKLTVLHVTPNDGEAVKLALREIFEDRMQQIVMEMASE